MAARETSQSASQPGHAWATPLGLVVGLFGLPALAVLARSTALDPSPLVAVAVRLGVLALVLGVVVRGENRPLSSIGVRRPVPLDLAALLAAAVLGLLALSATDPLVEALGLSQASHGGLGVAESGVGVALLGAVTVGVVEEVCYRGYAIERLQDCSGSHVVAGGLSWAVFTLAHAAAWQLGDLLQVSLAALAFTLVYLWRRSLVPVVGAHVLIWVVGVLGAVYG